MLQLRALVFFFLLMLLVNLPFHEPAIQTNPWLVMEKGLKVCGVEINTYQSYCFISKNEQEGIAAAGRAPLEVDLEDPPGSWYSMQDVHGNDEILLQICGTDRAACGRLWDRFAETINNRGENEPQVWSVEAFQSGNHDLTALGKELIDALGGRLRQVNICPDMVQMMADLPWTGEKILLDCGPVNLNLELYRDTYLEKTRIRLGIPVLLSLSNG